jgi:hypothetical protein
MRLSIALNILLVAVIAGGAYLFFIKGRTSVSADGRTAVVLTAEERDHVLADMRGLLENVQGLLAALGKGDMQGVAEHARNNGFSNHKMPPVSLMTKMPAEFRALGDPMHSGFDDIAIEAESIGDRDVIVQKLGAVLQVCTGCHASYTLKAESSGN